MEPDYVKHAREVIERLRLKPAASPASSATQQIVFNAPRDCVFVITPATISPAPTDQPERKP